MNEGNHHSSYGDKKNIIKEYYGQWYTNKLDTVDKMEKQTHTTETDSRRDGKYEQIHNK